jgi:hypothetical protein
MLLTDAVKRNDAKLTAVCMAKSITYSKTTPPSNNALKIKVQGVV